MTRMKKEGMIDDKGRVDLRAITAKRMKREKWSQADLARMLGTTRSVVCDWLHCRKDFGQERIECLLELLGAKFE